MDEQKPEGKNVPCSALLGSAASQWEVRVAGPDDVIACATELEAHRMANATNKLYLADRLKNPDNEVLCVATVHERPNAQAHATPRHEVNHDE